MSTEAVCPCCMHTALFTREHTKPLRQYYRVGRVVANVHKQVMPESCHSDITPESLPRQGEAILEIPTPPIPPLDEPGPSGTAEETSERVPIDILEEFVQDWILTLDKDDKKSLAMLLCYVFVKEFSFTETRAAEASARIVSKSDKTVRRW